LINSIDSYTPARIEHFGVFPIERAVVKPVNRKNNHCSFWNGHTFNSSYLLTVSLNSILKQTDDGPTALKYSVGTRLQLNLGLD
jgi:hypothetical protein